MTILLSGLVVFIMMGCGSEGVPSDTGIIPGNTAPVITLNGVNPMDIAIGGTYSEQGATAVDIQDGDLTSKIQISGNVDETALGKNTITYTVTDSGGLTATDRRIVNVVLPVGVKKTGQKVSDIDYDDGWYQKGIEPLYVRDDTTEIVTDYIAQLMWQDDVNVLADTNKMTYTGAINYCNNLSLGGFNDWRLPTIEELLNIVDKGSYDPAIDPTFKNLNTTGYFYWSSTETALRTNQAWTVYFEAGTDHYRDITGLYNVRCVRP